MARLDARIVSQIPLSAYLGAVGMPGVTAWCGLKKVIAVKAGETVVVSAAGSAEKCRAVLDDYGFNACIEYRQFPDVPSVLKGACPDGVDGYFENVGGIFLDAILARAAPAQAA